MKRSDDVAPPNVPWPTAPSAEAWAAMTPEARARTVRDLEVMALPDELIETQAQGDLHLDAKITVRDTLRRYFAKSGGRIYVAAELPVFYPGQRVFAPDVLAVRDVELHPRTSWFVSAEGKGLDLVLEVIAEGDRKKDLVENVERYAKLGIAEYFVLDLPGGWLYGHHLDPERPRRYRRMVPQGGLFHSAVLGLDLGISDGRLCFYQGTAQLLTAQDLATKLERMVDDLATKHQQEQALRTEEQALRAQEQALRAQEQTRREALERQMKVGIVAVVAARGLSLTDEDRARIFETDDAERLGRCLVRAATVTAIADLFTDA